MLLILFGLCQNVSTGSFLSENWLIWQDYTWNFAQKYWADPTKVIISAASAGGADIVADDAHGFTQMEHNFSLFWGL